MSRDVVVVRRHRRGLAHAMPLAMLTIKKELHGFLFLCMYAVPFL